MDKQWYISLDLEFQRYAYTAVELPRIKRNVYNSKERSSHAVREY